MARLTGKQRREKQVKKRTTITPKPVKGDTKKVKIKGRTRTRYYDGKKWVDKVVYRESPKLSKIKQRTEELRIRNRANEELLTKNRAALATKGASRNWDNPVGDELWKEDTMEPETGGWDEVEGGQPTPTTIANLQAINKYKAEKFEKERQAGWAEADLQDARDLGADIPPDKGGKGGVSESKASGGVSWGTDKKYPLMIGGKKTSQIQRKLIDAGHDPIKLAELMKKHKEKYGNRGFLGIGGR
jgi:hypothetical protein